MFCVTANKSKGRQLTFTQKYIRAVHKYSYVGFFFGRGGGGEGWPVKFASRSYEQVIFTVTMIVDWWTTQNKYLALDFLQAQS